MSSDDSESTRDLGAMVITGAGRGIGAATARLAARRPPAGGDRGTGVSRA